MRQLSIRASTINAGQQCSHMWFLDAVILPAVWAAAPTFLFRLGAYQLWNKLPIADRLDFIGMMLMGGEL